MHIPPTDFNKRYETPLLPYSAVVQHNSVQIHVPQPTPATPFGDASCASHRNCDRCPGRLTDMDESIGIADQNAVRHKGHDQRVALSSPFHTECSAMQASSDALRHSVDRLMRFLLLVL